MILSISILITIVVLIILLVVVCTDKSNNRLAINKSGSYGQNEGSICI